MPLGMPQAFMFHLPGFTEPLTLQGMRKHGTHRSREGNGKSSTHPSAVLEKGGCDRFQESNLYDGHLEGRKPTLLRGRKQSNHGYYINHFQATKFSWNPHVSEGFPPKKITTNESPRDDWKWFRIFYVGFAGPGCLENVPPNIFSQMVSLIVTNSIGSQSHTWDTS